MASNEMLDPKVFEAQAGVTLSEHLTDLSTTYQALEFCLKANARQQHFKRLAKEATKCLVFILDESGLDLECEPGETRFLKSCVSVILN